MEQYLIENILIPVGTSILIFLVAWIFAKVTGIISKLENDKVAYHLNKASELVKQSVLATNQKFVDELKAEGKFDKDSAEKAFQRTVDSALPKIDSESRNVIDGAVGDFNQWMADEIEKQVAEANQNTEKIEEKYTF